jgi:hypothetical protein
MTTRLLACTCLGLALLAGCNSGGNGEETHYSTKPVAQSKPQINLTSSNREIGAGDTTTLVVNSRNTLGRNAQVEWTSSGGKLETEDNGQTARVRFPDPGVFTVTARLIVDGAETDRDSITINVRPLHY